MSTPSEDEFDLDDCIASESLFDPEQGIWFKYGRLYHDAAGQIAEFEASLGVRLPQDFLRMIGDHCQGGFDGWYRVLKDDSGSLVWTHLLLMKLPDSVDEENDELTAHLNQSHIATRILDSKRELFFRNDKIALMPFGSASRFQSDGTGLNGFLAFDVANAYRIVFIHSPDFDAISISDSFSAMMKASVFQFFG